VTFDIPTSQVFRLSAVRYFLYRNRDIRIWTAKLSEIWRQCIRRVRQILESRLQVGWQESPFLGKAELADDNLR
jgi:hypothetical protein